LKTINL